MRWFSETAVRTGPLNYLVGSHQSPAGRLGEQIGNRLSATAPQSVPTVAATERLAARLRAGGAEKVTVSAALHSGYLDLELFDTDSQQTAAGLQESIGSLDGPVVLHSTAGWDVLLPIPAGAGDQVLAIPLTAVPVAELGGLLDTIATAQPASVRLGFTAHQMVALATGSPHALLTAETTRFDLTVTAGTGIEVIAQLVGRRPRLHRLDVHLDAGMITVAKASLLATIAARVEELSLYWDPADDDLVRSTIVPQISLAYRDNPAFHRWTVELERQLLLPFDILAVRAPGEAATAIVAASIQDIPAELIGTEMVIYAPATGTDVGQRDVRFEGSALHDATAMQVGAHRLQLLPYAAARPVGTDPVVRHLGTSADLEAFRADADSARDLGVWSAVAAELENDARFLHQDSPNPLRQVLFCDAAGVRTTRLLPAKSRPSEPGSADASWLGAYVTALRLRRRFGHEITVSGFPAATLDPAASDAPATSVAAPTALPRWVVGRLPGRAIMAEIGYQRRVFQVPDWLAALVESVQDGADRDGAVAAAAELAGTTPTDCARLLLELAA